MILVSLVLLCGTARISLTDHAEFLLSGSYSDSFHLDFGVLQGSVTGPLCFVYYTHVVGRILRRHNVKYQILC